MLLPESISSGSYSSVNVSLVALLDFDNDLFRGRIDGLERFAGSRGLKLIVDEDLEEINLNFYSLGLKDNSIYKFHTTTGVVNK